MCTLFLAIKWIYFSNIIKDIIYFILTFSLLVYSLWVVDWYTKWVGGGGLIYKMSWEFIIEQHNCFACLKYFVIASTSLFPLWLVSLWVVDWCTNYKMGWSLFYRIYYNIFCNGIMSLFPFWLPLLRLWVVGWFTKCVGRKSSWKTMKVVGRVLQYMHSTKLSK